MFMLHGRLAALPGRRHELLAVLTAVSDDATMPGCRLYVVSVDLDDPDGVWATEIWETEEAHTASLQLPTVQERIAGALPLLDRSGMQQQRLDALAGVPDA